MLAGCTAQIHKLTFCCLDTQAVMWSLLLLCMQGMAPSSETPWARRGMA